MSRITFVCICVCVCLGRVIPLLQEVFLDIQLEMDPFLFLSCHKLSVSFTALSIMFVTIFICLCCFSLPPDKYQLPGGREPFSVHCYVPSPWHVVGTEYLLNGWISAWHRRGNFCLGIIGSWRARAQVWSLLSSFPSCSQPFLQPSSLLWEWWHLINLITSDNIFPIPGS